MIKRFMLLICFLYVSLNVAVATEASKFVEAQYQKETCTQAHITVKKEHTVEYQQKIGEQIVPAITYGYGDMKVKGCRKCRISYICLLDKDCTPMWSFIVPSK